MGYAVIVVLVFYGVTALLMYVSGIFIEESSSVRESVDIAVLALSAFITATLTIYGGRQLNKDKSAGGETNSSIGKIIRMLGLLGAVLLSLAAAGRAWKYFKVNSLHAHSSNVEAASTGERRNVPSDS